MVGVLQVLYPGYNTALHAQKLAYYRDLFKRAAENPDSLSEQELLDLAAFEAARERLARVPCTCNAGSGPHRSWCAHGRR